ncbi:c18.3 [Ichnoviriform fugitivi]|uniref:C18.3 n=1 Tax=Ichnoviriform fugitivi TaxID=265522 RepID=A2Q0I7_9VIRU|nr:c18.3 [Ichnoviriform fugitivi]BAF45702.1 c18.3 [Ichnoviriform fugitivi]
MPYPSFCKMMENSETIIRRIELFSIVKDDDGGNYCSSLGPSQPKDTSKSKIVSGLDAGTVNWTSTIRLSGIQTSQPALSTRVYNISSVYACNFNVFSLVPAECL